MVSVVIPTYNRGDYIAETIQSVLAQTFHELEVIVIDDGSTDNTAQVVAPFGERVRYVPQANRERSVSRNHGLRLAQGEFIAFLDSDDCWLPDALQIMVDILRREPEAALVAAGCSVVHDGQIVQEFFPANGADGALANGFSQLLRSNVIGSPSAVLVRRAALDRHGGFDEDRRILGVEDWELWTRLSYHAPLICRKQPLVRYRRHTGNSPLAGMRLRYHWLMAAVLRNLPLKGHERDEISILAARRLVQYAGDFSEINETEAACHCLEAASELHRSIAEDESYRRLATATKQAEADAASGFTTTLFTKEQMAQSQGIHNVLKKIRAESGR